MLIKTHLSAETVTVTSAHFSNNNCFRGNFTETIVNPNIGTQKEMQFSTYCVASGLATPTIVRVCPTLKDMFFTIIPCTQRRRTS